MKDEIKKIQQGGLRRRLALTAAGAKGGVGLLTSRASGMLLASDKRQQHNDKALEREASRFVKELGKLKGAYVKIGQMMALYGEHILPAPVIAALHTLEDQTASLHWSVIEKTVNKELGHKAADLEIEQKALAAASLAQAHVATNRATNNKDKLCLKIQYPEIDKAIDGDFDSVLHMLKLSRWVKQSREFEDWAQELKALLHEEVDYHRELETTQIMQAKLQGDKRFIVPTVYPDYSTKKLLTMDFVEGVDVMHPDVQALSLTRRNNLAGLMLEIVLKEVFEWGIMQTDPNFGNYRVQIGKKKSEDKLVLLDFGAVRELPDDFLLPLRQTIKSAYYQNYAELTAGLIGLNCIQETDSDEVKRSVADFGIFILEPLRPNFDDVPAHILNAKNQYQWAESSLLKRVAKKGAKAATHQEFTMPSKEFVLLIRKLSGVFSFIAALKAEFNGNDILAKYLYET